MSPDPSLDGVPDDELLGRIAAGEATAFAALFRRRQSQVYRFALHVTGAPAAAEDVTQDVFLAVIKDAGRYEAGRSGVVAWLCGIARNHARRRMARDGRLVALLDSDDGEPRIDVEAVAPNPLDAITQAEELCALRDALMTLPLHYREAIALCDLQELNYSEAAVALDCAVGTVRSRLHRGRALLAAKMRGGAPARQPITRCLV
jgi:RNA polymerase sigma-70 factor, ECF subfamily